MTDRGVVYMLMGTRHAVVLAVSVMTLRRWWDGPVTIFADEDGLPYAQRIADASLPPVPIWTCLNISTGKYSLVSAPATRAVLFKPHKQRRHRGYANKPRIPAMSPYRHTLQLDADTAIVGPLDGFIWPRSREELVVTRYCNWVTNARIVADRIKAWRDVAPEEAAKKLAAPYPAINTGVLSYGDQSPVAREHWLEMTMRKPRKFISDETAMDLIWTEHPNVRLEGDRWNWSPLRGQAPREHVRICHFHGKKHVGKMRDAWWPFFLEAWRCNFADIREWCPGGDKKLGAYLEEHPEALTCSSSSPV